MIKMKYHKRLITIFNVVVGIIATGVLIYKVPRGEQYIINTFSNSII